MYWFNSVFCPLCEAIRSCKVDCEDLCVFDGLNCSGHDTFNNLKELIDEIRDFETRSNLSFEDQVNKISTACIERANYLKTIKEEMTAPQFTLSKALSNLL